MNTVKFQVNTSEQDRLFNENEELAPKLTTPETNPQPAPTPEPVNENNDTKKEGGNDVK